MAGDASDTAVRAQPETPLEDWQAGGFGIYLHWPFCRAKCPYCDFNSHVRERIDTDAWQRALIAEIDRAADETPGREVTSVFFGGGTPSLMPPALVGRLLGRIAARWHLPDGAEVTLEANPTSVEASAFAGFRAAGVSRVSIGVQALDDTDLRRLGRLHSADEARRAISLAQRAFERVSFDLIYARQHQTAEAWQAELLGALAMGTDHLSLYQLTIEDGTVFGRRHAAGRLPGLPGEELAADLYVLTQKMCQVAGLHGYEIANHARPGSESRHNLVYWRSGDYIGIGPGAHGRITMSGRRWSTETCPGPEEWLARVAGTGSGETRRASLSGSERAVELCMMGLRLAEGIDLRRVRALDEKLLDMRKVQDLCDLGLVALNGDRLRLTVKGRPLLDAILRQIL